MTAPSTTPRTDEIAALRDLLAALLDLQTRLYDTLNDKLRAMRCADIDAMQAATAEEADLLSRFELQDVQRHAVTARLAARLGAPGSGPLRMSQVIARLGGSSRDELSGLTDALRETMLQVADANRVVALASHELSEHFKTVFDAMTQAAAESVGYSRSGRNQTRATCLLDAVG